MASQKPFVLVDNVFDRINLYTQATIQAPIGSMVGREVNYAADYRRERTYWQAINGSAGQYISSDLGAGHFANPDTLWIDRGHNLWGKTIRWYNSDRDVNAVGMVGDLYIPPAVPALGTVGGDPTTGWCVTEEGAIYTMSSIFLTPRQFHTVYLYPDAFVTPPIIPGVIMGKRIQLLGYSSVVDEDSGDRNVRSESSLIPGYSGDDRSYSARMVELKLSQIGAAEYDSSIRTLRRLLFDVNQPAVVCMNYGTYPERAWLYKYQGNRWNSPMTRVHRSASIPLYEHGPLIR